MANESNLAHERLIFCCSGASNVGALSFLVAMRLAQDGFGAFSCIAGIGSNNLVMIHAAKSDGEIVVIDGCPTGCARKIMDANLIPIDRYVIITELGIGKTHNFDVEENDIDIVMEEVKRSQKDGGPSPLGSMVHGVTTSF